MLKRLKSILFRWWILLIVALVVLAGAFFWWRIQQAKPTLTTVRPERETLIKTLEISGTLTAKEYAKLRFIAGGKIVYLGAIEGEIVKKDRTIATIDQRSLRNSLTDTLNDYSKERLDWDQTLDNTKDRTLPQSERRTTQKEQYDLNNSVLSVEAVDIAITNTVISAPFEGLLIATPTNVTGVTVLSTDAFELINPNSLIFQALVDEVDVSQVTASQSASITLDSYPDEPIASHVSFLSYKSAQSDSGTVFLVHIPIPSTNLEKYRIGMNGEVAIELARKENALTIPYDAVSSRDEKYSVTVKTGSSTTEDREITIGLETEEKVEVLSGLSETDEVVLPK